MGKRKLVIINIISEHMHVSDISLAEYGSGDLHALLAAAMVSGGIDFKKLLR